MNTTRQIERISGIAGQRATLEAHLRALDDEEWKRLDAIRTELERPIIAEMDAIFREQEEEAMKALESLRTAPIETRAFNLSLDGLFSAPKWLEITWTRLKDFFLRSIFSGYETGQVQGGIDIPDLTSFDPAVREQLEVMTARTRNITLTTSQDLSEIIDEALRNGWSIDRTAQEIGDKFTEYRGYRSKLIAQTNVTGAFGKGQKEAFSRAGLGKRWLSQRDGRVRNSHFVADGQEQHANDPFIVGSARLQFPGDPETNDFGEVANCRCSMLPVRIK